MNDDESHADIMALGEGERCALQHGGVGGLQGPLVRDRRPTQLHYEIQLHRSTSTQLHQCLVTINILSSFTQNDIIMIGKQYYLSHMKNLITYKL